MEASQLMPAAEFICPISLELMRDPVSVCTGVTYDRRSIEKWFEKGQDTCPATMQPLHKNHTLVPNHSLRSLIQHWCQTHPPDSNLVTSTSASSSPITKQQIEFMLDRIQSDPSNTDMLRKLRIKAKESARNSRCIAESNQALPILCSVLSFAVDSNSSTHSSEKNLWLQASEEAVSILALLPIQSSYSTRRALISPGTLRAISWILRDGSPQGMLSAMALVDAIATDKGAQIAVGSTEGLMESLVAILRRNANQIVVNSSLRVLLRVCLPSSNRVRATRAGAVSAVVELLPETEGGVAEHVLIVLELLCGCVEGRAALNEHALAIPATVKKVLRVSDAATEHAIAILWSVCEESGRSEALREKARGLGLFGKLLFLLRKDLSQGTRHKVIDILDKVYNAKMDYS